MPEWVMDAGFIIMAIVSIGAIGWAAWLEFKYTGPYSMLAASSEQKWRQAATLAFLYTIPLPFFGFIFYLSDPKAGQSLPIFCGSIWLAAFFIALLFKRWEFERHLKGYHRLNKSIKSGFFRQVASSPLTGWSFRLMNVFNDAERKKFFEVGYLQESEQQNSDQVENDSPSWFGKLTDNTKPMTNWFTSHYPNENILFVSIATLLDVDKTPSYRWLPKRLNQIRGVVILTEEFLFFKARILSFPAFINFVMMLIPLTISLGLIYLLYRGFSQVTTDSLLAVLPFFILLLVLIIPVSLMTLAFALAIYQCRSHQEKIPFREIQNIELETVPGVTRRLSSLTITTANRTYNITPTKNFSDENLQIFNRD